jgi:hypothetical protein
MDKKTLYIIAIVAAAALIYWKFFHHPHAAKTAMGTAAVKKKGGGGWRHRFSKLGKIAHMIPGVSQAEHMATGYVSAQTGGLLNL